MTVRARPYGDDRAVAIWQHRLAARVVTLALKDLHNGQGSREHRESARDFLAGSAMLQYWCEVGHLDRRRIEKHAGAVTAAAANGLTTVLRSAQGVPR